eukprot:1913000-Pleurochrysis_carterae.AAC.2
MEGDKEVVAHGHWYTGSRTIKQRWEDYATFRRARLLPIIGSQSLFKFGLLESRLDQIGERNDPEAASKRKQIFEAQ